MRKILAAVALSSAALAATATPSMAATAHAHSAMAVNRDMGTNQRAGGVPGPPPANETRTSHTTQTQEGDWNKAGADVGAGIAGLLSAFVVGIPSGLVDLFQNVMKAL